MYVGEKEHIKIIGLQIFIHIFARIKNFIQAFKKSGEIKKIIFKARKEG